MRVLIALTRRKQVRTSLFPPSNIHTRAPIIIIVLFLNLPNSSAAFKSPGGNFPRYRAFAVGGILRQHNVLPGAAPLPGRRSGAETSAALPERLIAALMVTRMFKLY